MTQRLYYDDAYLTVFSGKVVELGEDGRRVVLDRTAFYPTSGGQPFDTGLLSGVRVVDVIDGDGARVVHILDAPLPAAPGAQVEGSVDWPRRFDHMQQHTGQHILSAAFAEMGLGTVSVHFGTEASTVELAAETIAAALLREVEERANSVVFANVPVTVTYQDASEVTGLRRESKRQGILRVVRVGDVDRSACGGTHVRATGEIGAILLGRVERIRKVTRVEFVCGARAVRRARADFEAATAAAQALSGSVSDLPALVGGLKEQYKEAMSARRRMEDELAAHRAREIHAQTSPDASGIRRAIERNGSRTVDGLRSLAMAFSALPKAVLVGVVSAPPTLLVAASEDSGVDAGAELRRALAEVGGRGGGSTRLAQGTVPDAAALERAAALLTA